MSLSVKLLGLLKSPIEQETLWESMNPFHHLDYDNDSVLWSNKANCISVIKLRGIEYGGLSKEKLNQYFMKRLEFLKKIDDDIIITTHATREIEILDPIISDDEEYSTKIINQWNKNFKTSYKTYHYIVVSSNTILGGGLGKKVENSLSDNQKYKIKKLIINVKMLLANLNEYDAILLKDTELVSFFVTYINGKKLKQALPTNKSLKNILIESTVLFPKNEDHMIYKNNTSIYAKWLTIKFFNNDIFSNRLLEELLSTKSEFTIYQTFQKFPKDVALALFTKKEKNVAAHSESSGKTTFSDLDDLRESIEQNETYLFQYSFAIQVKNTNLVHLEKEIESIKEIVDSYGYRTAIETTNIEPLYWSILPDYNGFNATKRDLLSQNICALNTFLTISQGFDRCSWGNEPVTRFVTNQNTNYDFTFHNSTREKALGHTLVIAGSESGKTTLISFLATHSLKFKDLKVIAFDKLKGLYTWTKMLGGDYVEFNDDIGLNPLQLDETEANKEFLKSFFQIMGRKDDAKSSKLIDEALESVYEQLPTSQRNLSEFYTALGAKTDEDDIVANIYPWVHGSNKRFFGSTKDNLAFNSKITVFAMDSIFHNPEAPTLISLYIFQKIKQLKEPVLIFIDEIVDYLNNKDFAKKILELLLEIRKKDGVLILAAQDYKFFTENEIGRKILGTSLANLILFPEPADEEYQKALNLSDVEYEYIKNSTDKRKVLFKRVQTGTSTIINVDLSPLEKYLKIFNSSNDAVRKINILTKEDPKNYKEKFLND